ncbi:lipoate--protein ligase family protein [Pseudoalteromonas luteoviolacea]|uniref:lipoate--protein ligase family protein n=1 Tax=Pseudoalteromonas luteoviolacea TaxID=43657 RepID=UPI0011531507|nr:protein ligase [Pseudoalteromonas luteoviolacea]TQF66785.1 protein ligase [Pseudoalteromonas luteoviolacea]
MTEQELVKRFYQTQHWSVLNEPLAQSTKQALEQDTLLLKQVAKGKLPATLRLWECPQSLIVSRKEAKLPHFELACNTLAQLDWPVAVRDSGGTAVPHGPGILNFSLIFAQTKEQALDVDAIYIALCEPIRSALSSLGIQSEYGETPGAYCDGRFNLNIESLKVTGTAQRITLSGSNPHGLHRGVLAQAMIMVEADPHYTTGIVNQFYKLAGADNLYDPAASTSVDKHLAGSYAAGKLTEVLRQELLLSVDNFCS